MTDTSQKAFEAWHAQRSAEIISNGKEIAKKRIADGYSDSGPTHCSALLTALDQADGTGRDAWAAGQKALEAEQAQAPSAPSGDGISTFTGWIPVAERSPDFVRWTSEYGGKWSSEPVLISYISGNDTNTQIVEARANGNKDQSRMGDTVWKCDGLYANTLVTHWMPLPQPPQGDRT